MIARFAVAATVAALFSVVAAELQVLSPGGPDLWWVAKSQNTLAWSCKDSSFQTFTILIANKDVKILTAPLAIVGVQNNFDCSKTITQDQSNQQAAQGYTIQLADPLNSTHIYAESKEFEIKALGSAFPTTTVGASSTGAGTATASGSEASKSSGASPLKISVGLGAAAALLGFITA